LRAVAHFEKAVVPRSIPGGPTIALGFALAPRLPPAHEDNADVSRPRHKQVQQLGSPFSDAEQCHGAPKRSHARNKSTVRTRYPALPVAYQ